MSRSDPGAEGEVREGLLPQERGLPGVADGLERDQRSQCGGNGERERARRGQFMSGPEAVKRTLSLSLSLIMQR